MTRRELQAVVLEQFEFRDVGGRPFAVAELWREVVQRQTNSRLQAQTMDCVGANFFWNAYDIRRHWLFIPRRADYYWTKLLGGKPSWERTPGCWTDYNECRHVLCEYTQE